MSVPQTALFDLNGTLTDPTAIGAPCSAPELGDVVLTRALQMAMAETIVGDYHDLSAHLEEALRAEVRLRGLDERRIDFALASGYLRLCRTRTSHKPR
jgi:hypothetical protein